MQFISITIIQHTNMFCQFITVEAAGIILFIIELLQVFKYFFQRLRRSIFYFTIYYFFSTQCDSLCDCLCYKFTDIFLIRQASENILQITTCFALQRYNIQVLTDGYFQQFSFQLICITGLK